MEKSLKDGVNYLYEKMERLIALVTNEGDVVLDSFMRSGTTGVACLNTKRRFIGMELDDTYFETAYQRSAEADKNKSQELNFS